MDLQEIGSESTDWIYLTRDRNMCRKVMNLLVPLTAGNFWTGQGAITFSRRTLLHGVRYMNNMIRPSSYCYVCPPYVYIECT